MSAAIHTALPAGTATSVYPSTNAYTNTYTNPNTASSAPPRKRSAAIFSKDLNRAAPPGTARLNTNTAAQDNRLASSMPTNKVAGIEATNHSKTNNSDSNSFNTADIVKTVLSGAALAARIALPLVL